MNWNLNRVPEVSIGTHLTAPTLVCQTFQIVIYKEGNKLFEKKKKKREGNM